MQYREPVGERPADIRLTARVSLSFRARSRAYPRVMRPADLAVIARTRGALASGAAREAREAARLSAAEVAAAIGVSRQSVHAWEWGRKVPSAANALAYGRALAALAPR
jgi:DNA-binding transcriptional regulator YiaG